MSTVLKKFSISTFANLLVLLVSVFSNLAFPKVLSIEDYSYWEVYVFYKGFVTIAGFGWAEGIYLKNGGKTYSLLDPKIYSFQTYGLLIFVSVIFVCIGGLSYFFTKDEKLLKILLLVCLEGIIFNMRVYPLYLMQATDRIKHFSVSIMIGRGVFFATSILALAIGYSDLYLLIFCDIFGCICCSAYSYWKCREKLLCAPCGFKQGFSEAKENIGIGFSLMAANMVGVAITGVIKYAIQTYWSVIEFGKISFTITCTNLFLKFTTAVGTVLFPLLCNFPIDKLKKVYSSLTLFFEVSIGVILVLYYPTKLVLSLYLPQYAESLRYMAYLLPICLFETKVSLLLNTYFKAMRKERMLMAVNLAVLGTSGILAVLSTFVFSSIDLAIYSILAVLALRSFLLENILCRKYLRTGEKFVGLFSVSIAIVFVFTNGVIGGWVGAILYGVFALTITIWNFHKIKNIMVKTFRRQSLWQENES